MKTALSVMLVVAFAGCLVFGIAFTSAHMEVNKVKTQLETKQEELTSVQSDLAGIQSELDNKDTELAQVQANITNTETDLNAVTSELTAAQTELTQTKFDLTDANRNLNTATLKNTRMADQYTALREQINQKTGDQADSQIYVTPDDSAVAAQAAAIAGSFSSDSTEMWRDYKKMYDWVVTNIDYSSDTPIPLLPESLDSNEEITWFADYWKMPAETLTDKVGDCEDMANLLASMILSYNNQAYGVWLLEIHNKDSGHVAVAIPVVGDKLVILDPAGNYYSGHTLGYIQSAGISSAIDTWLTYWSDDMPGAEVTAVYSKDFNHDFSGTQEFIDWAKVH